MECLENIVNAWADGKRVTVQVVDASSDVAEDDNLSDNDESLPELATDNGEPPLDLADNLSNNDEPPLDLADNLSDNDESPLDLADNLSDNDKLPLDLADDLSDNDKLPLDLADDLSDNDKLPLDLADDLSDSDEPLLDLANNMSGNDEPPLDLANNLSDNDEPSLDLANNLSDNDEPLPDLGGEDILSHPSVRSGDDGGDTGSSSIDAECGYAMKDSTVSKVDHVQRSNGNRLDSSIKNDTNCFSKKKSYNRSNIKKNLNDLHDSKKGNNDLSGKKEKCQRKTRAIPK